MERDYFYHLEFDDFVKDFDEQPFKIQYVNEKSEQTRYTPDVLIELSKAGQANYGVKHKLCEVKYEEDLVADKKELQPRFDAAYAHAQKKGWIFEIVTDTTIRVPRLKVFTFLMDYLDTDKYDSLSAENFRVAKQLKKFNVEQFMNNIAGSKTQKLQSIGSLWHMVAKGEFTIDLDKEVDESTIISIKHE
ncbi:MAG: TnsA endonuclease N-terminal domain-containing protein [Cyclobacteriaceae bacterium]